MTAKQVLFHSAAREKVLRGTEKLADAVRLTLGPKSKSVLIQKKWGAPTVCNDGVTIAKEMELQDPEENLGAQMLRQAAERTGDLVGDGTSTATVLAHAIFADGVRNVTAGASAIDLKRGLDRGLQAALQALRAHGEAGQQPPGEGAGRDHLGAQRPADRRTGRGRHGEGRRRRRDHRGGVQDHGDHARRGGGPAVRPRLPVALLRDRHAARWKRCWRTPTSCSPSAS